VIFGLPLDAWALLAVAVGAGLALELAFLRARGGRPDRTDRRPPESES
jgi:hypothetical protein